MPPSTADAKIEGIEKLVSAKFDAVDTRMVGMERTLERVVTAIEKQADQNAAVMVLATRLDAHLDNFSSHKVATTAALSSHSKRIDAVEKRSQRNSWRISDAKALVFGIGSALLSLTVLALDHFSEIVALFHGG